MKIPQKQLCILLGLLLIFGLSGCTGREAMKAEAKFFNFLALMALAFQLISPIIILVQINLFPEKTQPKRLFMGLTMPFILMLCWTFWLLVQFPNSISYTYQNTASSMYSYYLAGWILWFSGFALAFYFKQKST